MIGLSACNRIEDKSMMRMENKCWLQIGYLVKALFESRWSIEENIYYPVSWMEFMKINIIKTKRIVEEKNIISIVKLKEVLQVMSEFQYQSTNIKNYG